MTDLATSDPKAIPYVDTEQHDLLCHTCLTARVEAAGGHDYLRSIDSHRFFLVSRDEWMCDACGVTSNFHVDDTRPPAYGPDDCPRCWVCDAMKPHPDAGCRCDDRD